MHPKRTKSRRRKHLKGRSLRDRRCGDDRRKAYNLDYFLKGGAERRNMAERRRRRIDRRKKWVMVDNTCSVPEDI